MWHLPKQHAELSRPQQAPWSIATPINNPQDGDGCCPDPQPHVLLNFLQVDSHSTRAGIFFFHLTLCLWRVLSWNNCLFVYCVPSHYVNIAQLIQLVLQLMTIWVSSCLGLLYVKMIMDILMSVCWWPEPPSHLSVHTPRNRWSWKHVCLPVGDTAEQFPRWYHSALQPRMSESPSCPTIVTLVSVWNFSHSNRCTR